MTKIKTFLAFVLLYFCTLVPPVDAAITRGVGPVDNDNYEILTAILTGTTAGGMIVIVVGQYSGTILSVTISGETDPTRITAADLVSLDSFGIFYLANNTGGGDKTITVTLSDSFDYGSMIAMEYLGQDTTTQPDATTTPVIGFNGGPVQNPTISIATATAGDLILTVCDSNGGKPTMPSGYSDLNLSNPGYYANAADNVNVGVPGTKTLIWTDVFNSDWGVTAVAFKAASVGGGGSIRHRVIGQ